MGGLSAERFGCPDLQEFVDTAITEPNRLKEIAGRARRQHRWPGWAYGLLGGAALAVALAVGLLLGRLVR
jgi:hypothetical protein